MQRKYKAGLQPKLLVYGDRNERYDGEEEHGKHHEGKEAHTVCISYGS